jgi:radical SAM enzyme (TIGR01210 family)
MIMARAKKNVTEQDNSGEVVRKPEVRRGRENLKSKIATSRELKAVDCLVNAEVDFELLTIEQRRLQVQEWILNSEFASFAPQLEEIFLSATKQVSFEGKDLAPKTEWGLSTADAERCLTDVVRTEKFRQALRETIKDGDSVVEANVNTGDTVVEAGAGTGILAMMAAVMGARKVYAVEINPQTVKACRAFLEYCGFNQGVVEVIETDATTCDLPEQVDVILSENMYTGLFVEPQMQIINNLRRFLKPGGKIIPEKFFSYLELVEAPGLKPETVVRNEAGIPLKSATTRAQFDIVNFERDEKLDRQGMVIIRATNDTVVEAMNVSSVIDLSSKVRIESNICDFLGQDELVKLAVPVALKAGELYQINIDYRAGCKPQDIKITIEPAKKLRLDAAVSDEMRDSEAKKRMEVEANLNVINQAITEVDPDLIPPDEEKIKKILGHIEGLVVVLTEIKNQGLFELFELAHYYENLEEVFSRFKCLPLGYVEGIDSRLKQVEQELSLEKKQREIESVFSDAVESICALNSNDDIDLERVRREAPVCATKILHCAEVLFDYKVGGTFRLDEFYSYIERLQTYHAALQKFIVGQDIEVSEEYKNLMVNLQKELTRHRENLGSVPELVAGTVRSPMSFEQYNELAIKMTDLYVQYLQAREGDPQAVVNSEKRADLNKYVSCQEATAKNGSRLMIEFRGKKGCEFGRCSNCCFATDNATDQHVRSSHISRQFETALKDLSLEVEYGVDGVPQWKGGKKDLYKFDILTPGSFLNDREMPKSARTEIFKKIATLPFTQIMFESRIEYLDEAEIVRLKGLLRPDQKLQVAIGLETANNIIREVIINKGYTLSEFEKAVEMLASNGVDVQAYSIIKPALLTEKQALEDSVETGRYLAGLTDRIRQGGNKDFELTFKLEQAFIQDGGFLDFLHKRGKYETPWTFTTAEIVNRLCAEGLDKKLNIQIGTSHDYPPPTTAAQNRTINGEYCPSTQMVDEALQQFNVSNDGDKFKKSVEEVRRLYPDTYARWSGRDCVDLPVETVKDKKDIA